MSEAHGFTIDQLMELAGLSVAAALLDYYPPTSHKSVLVLVGPGNNGGDGLVAARHLYHFGYNVQVCYPKRTDKARFHNLVAQCQALAIPFLKSEELTAGELPAAIILDALFGFSFKGPPRAPLDKLLDLMKPSSQPPAVVSVDIPSGWDVEKGDISETGLRPDVLVSLTAPKLGVRDFTGVHYLGGRFVPPSIKDKYSLRLPTYQGASQCVRIQ